MASLCGSNKHPQNKIKKSIKVTNKKIKKIKNLMKQNMSYDFDEESPFC